MIFGNNIGHQKGEFPRSNTVEAQIVIGQRQDGSPITCSPEEEATIRRVMASTDPLHIPLTHHLRYSILLYPLDDDNHVIIYCLECERRNIASIGKGDFQTARALHVGEYDRTCRPGTGFDRP